MSASWGLGGVLGAGLALIALEAVTSSDTASTGLAAVLQWPGQWAQAWMDPTKPLIPQTSGSTALPSSLTSSGAGTPIGPVISAALNPPGLKNPPPTKKKHP